MHNTDFIKQIHVEAFLNRHHIWHLDQTGWNLGYVLLNPPKNIVNALEAEAPTTSFSIFSSGKREFSDGLPTSSWKVLTLAQIQGRAKAPFPTRQLLSSQKIQAIEIQTARYYERKYIGLDHEPHSGFEVEVELRGDVSSHIRWFQVSWYGRDLQVVERIYEGNRVL